MASINKVILIGNLGADPEIRVTASGEQVCNLRLATTENWKRKGTGDPHEATEWHRVVLYRRLAEIARDYLRKGSSVYVEGRLRTRKWMTKDGKERWTTEIEVSEITMLGNNPNGTGTSQMPVARTPAKPTANTPPSPVDEYDYPF